MAAPVIGGSVLKVTSWRGVFGVLFVLGALVLAACIHFNESLSTKRRTKQKLIKTLALFKPLFFNRRYIFYTLQMGFAQALLFAYIAASPFIIQQYYGFSPFAFSLFFAANAVAIGTGAALSVKFKRLETCILTSCIGMLVCSVAVLCALQNGASIVLFEGLLFIMLLAMGLTFTAATTLAMNAERARAGTASALFGAVCFLFGGLVSPLAGLGDILLPTGITFTACAALSLVCGVMAVKK